MLHSFDSSVTWPLAPPCWSITTTTTTAQKQQHKSDNSCKGGVRERGCCGNSECLRAFFASSLLGFLSSTLFHLLLLSFLLYTDESWCACVCLYVYVARFGNIFQELLILNNSKVRWTHHKHTHTHMQTHRRHAQTLAQFIYASLLPVLLCWFLAAVERRLKYGESTCVGTQVHTHIHTYICMYVHTNEGGSLK